MCNVKANKLYWWLLKVTHHRNGLRPSLDVEFEHFYTIFWTFLIPIYHCAMWKVNKWCWWLLKVTHHRNGLRPSLDMNSIIFSAGFLTLLPNRFTATGTRSVSQALTSINKYFSRLIKIKFQIYSYKYWHRMIVRAYVKSKCSVQY